MFAFDGKSYDEIAVAQGIAKATVGTRILSARLRIREILVDDSTPVEYGQVLFRVDPNG